MSHMLEMVVGPNGTAQAQIAYASETPWHGLGVKVPDDLTPDQIMTAAGVNWNVEKVPAFIDLNGEQVPTGRSALVRDRDNKILDIVTDDWEPLQNSDAFAFFNDFIEAGNMKMDTAGSLKDGRIVWALAKTTESFSPVANDVVESYLLFTNPHQFGRSIDVRFTNVRVVCNNTLTLANNAKATNGARVTHRSEFDPEYVKEVMGISNRNMSRYSEMASFLAQKRYDKENIVEYFNRIFPVLTTKEKSTKELSKNAKIAMSVLETQPGADLAPGTWWNAFNAVTFSTNHILGRNQNNRVQSLFYGANRELNVKALNTAVEYAEAA